MLSRGRRPDRSQVELARQLSAAIVMDHGNEVLQVLARFARAAQRNMTTQLALGGHTIHHIVFSDARRVERPRRFISARGIRLDSPGNQRPSRQLYDWPNEVGYLRRALSDRGNWPVDLRQSSPSLNWKRRTPNAPMPTAHSHPLARHGARCRPTCVEADGRFADCSLRSLYLTRPQLNWGVSRI